MPSFLKERNARQNVVPKQDDGAPKAGEASPGKPDETGVC